MDAARSNPPTSRRRATSRRALGVVVAVALCSVGGVTASQADLHNSISAQQAAANRLKTQIAAESERIAATSDGVAQATRRLTALQAQATARKAQLIAVQHDVVATRNQLTRLENKLLKASNALSANLVSSYEGDVPDATTVVLQAHGFSDLLETVDFLKIIARKNAQILGDTKTARAHVLAETTRLAALQQRDAKLTAAVIASRNSAAAVQSAILAQQAQQLQSRSGKRAQLASVRGRIAALQARQARIARAAVRAAAAPQAAAGPTGSGTANSSITTDAGGQAQASAGAPAAVRQVIAAGNAIAGLPYSYGGGHASFQAAAYDCSGSVSYALAAAGLVSSPLDSTAFESWGEAGPGQWITVYANAGHAFMVIDGWRFDTVALAQDGTRFTRTMTSTAGFVARHPPGL